MKKIAILMSIILSIILLSGCIPTTQIQTQKPAETQTSPNVKLGEGTTNINKTGAPQQNTFIISEGKSITFNNKKITLKNLNFRNEMTLNIDGKDYVFFQTKVMEIVKGLEIYPLEFHFDPEGEDTYVNLEIKKLVLKENEHIMYKGESLDIPNKGKIILKDVNDDNVKSIRIQVRTKDNLKEERINKMETKNLLDIKITNIYPRARAISLEKYALIRVE